MFCFVFPTQTVSKRTIDRWKHTHAITPLKSENKCRLLRSVTAQQRLPGVEICLLEQNDGSQSTQWQSVLNRGRKAPRPHLSHPAQDSYAGAIIFS